MTHLPQSLPHSDDCERGLLCSMILSAEVRSELVAQIPSEAFYNSANRIVFDVLHELDQSGSAFDFHLVKKWLTDTNRLAEVGGAEGLSLLWSFVPTSANWQHYAEIVGENYQRRNVILRSQKLIAKMYDQRAEFEGGLTEHVEKMLMKLVLDIPKVEKAFRSHVLDTLNQIEAETHSQGTIGARFGVRSLDTAIGGIRPSEYVVICAETSGGKSALALSLILHEAKRGIPVTVFSLEMSSTQVIKRMLASDGQLSMKTLRSGFLTQHDFSKLTRSAERVSKLPIHCEEGYNLSIPQIVSRVRLLKVRHNIGLVVVDYLQLISSGAKETSREREIAEISRRLRLLALELEIPVVALSQLNDQGYLRESRAIGHDADTVIHIEDSDSEDAFERNVVLVKNRNGRCGEKVKLNFYGEFMTFEDTR
jgi:replicative DNA helicase